MSNSNRKIIVATALTAGIVTVLLIGFVATVIRHSKAAESLHQYVEVGDISGIDGVLKQGYSADLCDTDEGQTPLWLASEFGDINCVNYLLAHGASVNCKDRLGQGTPLTQATKADIIEVLVTHGADPNAISIRSKSTALHTCAEQAFQRTALVLLQHGANPTMRDDKGKTPAEVATANEHADLAGILKTAEAEWSQRR